MKKIITIIFILCCSEISSQATTTNDTIDFALLTCWPGNEVYSLYGHTAIRYQNKTTKSDLTFNYGVFNFKKKNFAWNFAMGRTDYELGVVPFKDFREEYEHLGRKVVEQVLNLTQQQKLRLRELLYENWQPENATYRYNYFYDNCTSRARDIIYQAINSDSCHVEKMKESAPKFTWRQDLHTYTSHHPWAELGDDLSLGQPADKEMTDEERQFLPMNLMNDFEISEIITDTATNIPLVLYTNVIYEGTDQPKADEFPLTPLQCSAILALVCVILFLIEIKKKKIFISFDIVLMVLQIISGCIIFILMISEHPATCFNWNILIYNPLAIIALPFVVIAWNHKKLSWWDYYITSAFIAIILIDLLMIQNIPLFTEILAACLLTRVSSRVLVYRKQ